MAELVDATDSKSVFFGSAGSSPVIGTKEIFIKVLGMFNKRTSVSIGLTP